MFITTRGLFPSREDNSGVHDWLQKSVILSPPVLSLVKTMRLTVKADSWSLPEQRWEKPTTRHKARMGIINRLPFIKTPLRHGIIDDMGAPPHL
jgi:hypothetical protein